MLGYFPRVVLLCQDQPHRSKITGNNMKCDSKVCLMKLHHCCAVLYLYMYTVSVTGILKERMWLHVVLICYLPVTNNHYQSWLITSHFHSFPASLKLCKKNLDSHVLSNYYPDWQASRRGCYQWLRLKTTYLESPSSTEAFGYSSIAWFFLWSYRPWAVMWLMSSP